MADRYAEGPALLSTVAGQVHDSRVEPAEYFDSFLAKEPQGALTELVVRVLGDELASHSGLYQFSFAEAGGGPHVVDARFTFLYAKQDGVWKLVEHHSSKVPG